MQNITERIETTVKQQHDFFASGATLDIEVRRAKLAKLKKMVQKHEKEICEALFLDLHKSPEESMLTEIQVVLSEIDYHLKHLSRWMKPRQVSASRATFPGRSMIHYQPYGVVLIISPWNYPFQLLLNPLVGAIAAGNCAVLKPSPQSAHTATLLGRLFNEYFSDRYITLFEGDTEVNQILLAQKYDYIFFTGGPVFGKYVAECAARTLTPVTLELGGKSPCIVDKSADIDLAARRIVWGKLLNAGQTCIAPDYVLVDNSCKNELIKKLEKYIIHHFGINPELSAHYPHIISEEATRRLANLLPHSGNILFGGQYNIEKKYFSPTLINEPAPDSPLMQEEIFGPILPLIGFDRIEEAILFVNKRPKPLALYYFGDKSTALKIMHQTSSGGMCINDTIMHIVNQHLPFGGVGDSGMGRYHGRESFITFSNPRSVHQSPTLFDLKFRYAPYKIPQFLKRFL
ncbi:MAG: aldehyde dehydrogenase [Bacteroidales bacterium]